MTLLNEVEDPRRPSNGTLHDFQEILVIAICAVLSDADNVDDFAAWARVKEDWLRRFLALKNGIPSQDTFLRVFGAINPKQFEAVFRRWVGSIVPALSRTIAVDGKTLRGSGKGSESPVHMVSAFATDLGLVLGQEKVVGKSNEITAIPELLQALYLNGHLVTIDAMGCQKAIAAQIVAQKGDYLLAVKGNLIRKQTVSVLAPGAGEGSAPTSLAGATPAATLAGGLPLTSAPGYRWLDRNGSWIDYDQSGQIVAYGDKNDLRVWFEYGTGSEAGKLRKVRDHFGRTVLTYLYAGEQVGEIRDNPALIAGNGSAARSVKYTWDGSKLIQATDVLGYVTTYTYEGSKLKTSTDPESRTRTLNWGPTGRINNVKEADGTVTGYLYDYDKTRRQFYNRLTHPATAAGSKVEERWYDNDGKLIRSDINGKTQSALLIDTAERTRTSTDAQGRRTVTTLDEFDNIVKVTYPDGSTTSARYSPAHGGVLEETDELGVKSLYEYDAKGNRIRTSEAVGLPEARVTETTVDAFGQIAGLTRKGGTVAIPGASSVTIPDASTAFESDTQGNPIKVSDAEGYVTQIHYDLMGKPVQVTDARGKIWKTSYNARGRELTRSNPLNQTTNNTWNKVGERIGETDAAGNTSTFAYDTKGRLTQITNALGHTRKQEVDALGHPRAQINEAGQRTIEFTYDLDGRLAQTKDGSGNAIAWQYGDDGRAPLPTHLQYPGFIRQLGYDPRDRATEIKDVFSEALVYSTQQAYDKKGNLIQVTDRNGKVTQLAYDGLGHLTQVTDPASGLTRYAYDPRDNLIAVTDPNGNTTAYTTDRNNRRIRETRPLGQSQTYRYDETGNFITMQDAKGNKLQATYDAAGQRIEEKHLTVGGDATRTITYTWNAAGSLTGYTDSNSGTPNAVTHSAAYTLDALQRKTQDTITLGGNSFTTTTTWTPTGQKASQTSPGNLKADYSYDAGQNLASITLPSGSIGITERQWNAPRKLTFPGGSQQTRVYDALLRPTRIKVNDPGQATLIDRQYTFDAESNITQKVTEHGNYDYQYDNLYRLTQVGNPSGLPNEAWTYDKLGNRLSDKNRGGGLFGSPSLWQYNGNNQLLKSFTTSGEAVDHSYDDNGSLIRKQSLSASPTDNQQFIYDAANRLVEVKDTNGNSVASYQYDPFGRRIAKTTGQGTTFYLYSDEGLITEATATGSIAVEYGWQPNNTWGTDPLFIKTTRTNGSAPEVFYYQNDHLGTPQKVIDQLGSVVWEAKALAFGETTVASSSVITNNLRFPGQVEDQETGARDNWFRTYGAGAGTYWQGDPIGLAGGINSYAYVGGNPLSYADPLGLAATVVAQQLPGGGYSFYAFGSGQQGSISGTFNTNTANFNQLQPGTYSVNPRPTLPIPWWNPLSNKNANAGRPTISNTANWNTIVNPNGTITQGAQIHPGTFGTSTGTSLACMVTDQGSYSQLNSLFQQNYANGGVTLVILPTAWMGP